MTDTFATSEAANYVESLYDEYKKNPSGVHISWRTYFQNMEAGVPSSSAFSLPPTLTNSTIYPVAGVTSPTSSIGASASAPQINEKALLDHMKVSYPIHIALVECFSLLTPPRPRPRPRPLPH